MNQSWCLALGAVALGGCLQPNGSAPSDGGAPASSASIGVDAGSFPDAAKTDSGVSGKGGPSTFQVVGALDAAVTTKLPALPAMTNVVATQREDSVGIDFDPVNGAVDYRVYLLPKDADITVNGDGSTTVANAVYRCAGLRQTFDVANNTNSGDTSLLISNKYAFKTDVGPNPTLGYVFVTPASDRVPVYAVAGSLDSDDKGWRESRFKIYTADAGVRQSYLDQAWRDDGIVFYVPKSASANTHTVYSSQKALDQGTGVILHNQYYILDSDVGAHSGDATPPAPAFQLLSEQAPDTQPLMLVTYLESNQHAELAVGPERFKRAANQGDGPLWHVEWSGITEPSTLVVEALASGCPFQGFLSPQHIEAPNHQTFLTLADLQAGSSTGEVFINGEYDAAAFPVATARSFVAVSPQPHSAQDWDWYQGFSMGSDLGPVTNGAALAGCSDCSRLTSPSWDISTYLIDGTAQNPVFAYGVALGELWVAYDDAGSDVTGKVRFTATQKANVDSDSTKFLHATMSVDIVTTDRRYPQLIVSDQDAPVQEGLSNPNNNTLLLQPILGPAIVLQAQAIHGLVNGGPWDVNNQQPGAHAFEGAQNALALTPAEPPFEHAGMDRLTRIDLYLSSGRMYAFLDGAPSGCSLLPSDFQLNGPVTVTVGDVLYHEGAADELICSQTKPYRFMHSHQCKETKRHFDDVAFKSGVGAPAWDESRFPCVAY